MDPTTTCPTCGHTENASLKTCSFCGVDLDRYSEPQPDAEAVDTPTGDESISNLQNAGIGEELLVQNPPVKKPASIDEAVAHVLSADPIVDLVEEVESSAPVATPEAHSKQPEATGPEHDSTADSLPDKRLSEDNHSEAVVLPESVQLQAEEKAVVGGEHADLASAGAAVAKTAVDSKKEDLKKHRAALEKAEAVKKRKLAIARAAALKKKKMALKQNPPVAASIRTLKLLKPYQGKTIGINFDNSAVIAAAELVAVNSEYLTVLVKQAQLRYHFPLNTILSVIESVDGNGVPTGAENEVFSAVIKIYPLVLF